MSFIFPERQVRVSSVISEELPGGHRAQNGQERTA